MKRQPDGTLVQMEYHIEHLAQVVVNLRWLSTFGVVYNLKIDSHGYDYRWAGITIRFFVLKREFSHLYIFHWNLSCKV